jgi:hypothetical protein
MDLIDFFHLVWGEQEGNVVLGQMDRPGPKGELNRSWDFSWPHDAANIVAFCEARNGTDMYYSPVIYGHQRGKARPGQEQGRLRRIPENAISCRVVYQDSDTCTPDKFRLRPSVHLTTSTGKYQDLWVLHEPVTAGEAALMSRKIAVAHREDGSDPSSWSANKFLRIPGATNTRHGFPTTVTVESYGDLYDVSDINAEYGDVDVEVYRPIARLVDHYLDTDEDLPDFAESYNMVPGGEVDRLGLTHLIFEPYPEGRRSETRYRLLCQLFRVSPPLDFERILAIAWHAPAASKWREDARNVRGLIMEAQKAQTEVGYERGVGVSAPEPNELLIDELPRVERPGVSLLTDDERTRVQNENHFIRRYETWSSIKLGPAHNGPYARMNAWATLSCAFSDLGVIPSTGDALNLFAIGIGDSGSGKTSARRLFDHVTQEIFEQDKGWWIGAGSSPQGIHEALLERDHRVSVFMADEAHGWFNTVNNQQWAQGVYEDLCLYYDGTVPPIQKTTKRELSGKMATSYFLTHLMGTMKGEMSITNVLNRSMFFSGFIPRHTIYISDEKPVTLDGMAESNGDGEAVNLGFEPMARQWAAEFANTKKQLRAKHKRKRIPMNMSDDALKRLTQAKWQARELAKGRNEWTLLEPCMMRVGPNVRRAASLLALEDGRDTVNLTDLLIALEQAEEWLSNLFLLAEKVSASQWARDTDEIETFVSGKGGRALYEVVMRRFKDRRNRDLLEQINSLQAQGRVKEVSAGGKKYLELNQRKADE